MLPTKQWWIVGSSSLLAIPEGTKKRKQCRHSREPHPRLLSQTWLAYLFHIIRLGPVIECCTLSQEITKSSPWSMATCSMINPVLNLGASARTNRVLWRYASHQLSQAVVRQINSFTLDWMRNRGLARPDVALIERPPKPKGTEEQFSVSHFLSVSLLPLHSQAHVWFANRLLFQKVSFAPPRQNCQGLLERSIPIFGTTSGYVR